MPKHHCIICPGILGHPAEQRLLGSSPAADEATAEDHSDKFYSIKHIVIYSFVLCLYSCLLCQTAMAGYNIVDTFHAFAGMHDGPDSRLLCFVHEDLLQKVPAIHVHLEIATTMFRETQKPGFLCA